MMTDVLGRTLEISSQTEGFWTRRLQDLAISVPSTDSHLFKLRQLTVLSLIQGACFQASSVIPYTTLSQSFGYRQSDRCSGRDIGFLHLTPEWWRVNCVKRLQSFILSCTMPYRSRDVSPSRDGRLADPFEDLSQLSQMIL
jgi:hypothetical protein